MTRAQAEQVAKEAAGQYFADVSEYWSQKQRRLLFDIILSRLLPLVEKGKLPQEVSDWLDEAERCASELDDFKCCAKDSKFCGQVHEAKDAAAHLRQGIGMFRSLIQSR